jgi:hypothetical protein
MEHHRKFSSEGLDGALGDGYLLHNNRAYRAIRKAALAAGFKYSADRDEAYEAFPLLRLEAILKKKIIPYSRNASAFQELPESALELITSEDADGNLKKNFVLHEGCHAVVRLILNRTLPDLVSKSGIERSREVALRMILEESCANTAELIGCVDADDAVHKIFYELNSYVCEFESRTNLKKACDGFSREAVVRFLVLSYMQSNFLRTSIDDRQFNRMLKLSGLDASGPAQKKLLRALGKIAFNLSERFRTQTTAFHLRLNGISTPTDELFDFDFLALIESGEKYSNCISSFAKILG